VRHVSTIVQGGIQGQRMPRVPAKDLAVEVLLSGLSGADEAEGNGTALLMMFPVGQRGGLDHVFHVLGCQ
jgi:hypothetical protein